MRGEACGPVASVYDFAMSAAVYLDAVLEPQRSLSPRGFDRLMVGLAAFNFIVGVGFILAGALPVVGFMGLDVLLLWLAFRASFRAQTARTFVRVTADAVDVRKIDGNGRERRARLPAGFARVELDRNADGPNALRLKASSRAYAIGEHLTRRERESFARRLTEALAEARRERHPAE